MVELNSARIKIMNEILSVPSAKEDESKERTLEDRQLPPKQNQRGIYILGAKESCLLCTSPNIPSQNCTWCKSPRSAGYKSNSCDRQLLVYLHSPGSKPAATDVREADRRKR